MSYPRSNECALYLQIYPSTLVNASRMGKIGRSAQASGVFRATHLVGVQAEGQPVQEDHGDGLFTVRLRGSGRSGNLGRVLRALLWQPKVFLHYRKQDVAVVASHNVWVLPLCWALARATGATLIYNPHELETEAGTMRGLKKRAAQLVERSLIRSCALVSVVNEPIADWYQQTYQIERPVVIGNVPVVMDAQVGFREQLGVGEEEMLYVHTGHLVDGRNIPLIVDAFTRSPHHVAFLGDGPHRELIVSAQQQHPNVHWVPPVEPDLIVAHVREADVGLCLIDPGLGLSDQLSSPNKLMEALAADIPAFCTDLIEARRLLGEQADRWILADPRQAFESALATTTKADCDEFRKNWGGVRPWDEVINDFVQALVSRVEARRKGIRK